jgi:hypothetical protein
MSEEISREVLKLEARLEGFLKDEEAFVGELRRCMEKFKELNAKTAEIRSDPKRIDELMKLRLEAVKAFSEALKKESKAEHERSHLLESYGALIQALEEEFLRFSSPS